MTKELQEFQIIGTYRKNKKINRIKQIISAETKNYAIEILYSLIGSRHKVKRNDIKIMEVNKIE